MTGGVLGSLTLESVADECGARLLDRLRVNRHLVATQSLVHRVARGQVGGNVAACAIEHREAEYVVLEKRRHEGERRQPQPAGAPARVPFARPQFRVVEVLERALRQAWRVGM